MNSDTKDRPFTSHILIPIKNEIELLREVKTINYIRSLPSDFSFALGKEQEKCIELLESYDFKYIICHTKGLAQNLKEAASKVDAEYIVIHPIDCRLINTSLEIKKQWGAHFKRYDNNSLHYYLYSIVQNYLFTYFGKNLVWTNLIFCKKELLLNNLSDQDFLSDITLTDRLGLLSSPQIITSQVKVSTRRYKGVFLKRVWINFKIMVGYRVFNKPISELKELYYS